MSETEIRSCPPHPLSFYYLGDLFRLAPSKVRVSEKLKTRSPWDSRIQRIRNALRNFRKVAEKWISELPSPRLNYQDNRIMEHKICYTGTFFIYRISLSWNGNCRDFFFRWLISSRRMEFRGTINVSNDRLFCNLKFELIVLVIEWIVQFLSLFCCGCIYNFLPCLKFSQPINARCLFVYNFMNGSQIP